MRANAEPVKPALLKETGTVLAARAAAGEQNRAYWQHRFEALLVSDVIGALAQDPRTGEPDFAGQCGLAFRRAPADHRHFASSIDLLAHRIAPLASTGRRVCVDLSAARGSSPVWDDNAQVFAEFVEELQVKLPSFLGQLGVEPDSLMFSLPADHPGLRAFLDLRGSESLRHPALALRLSNTVMTRIRVASRGYCSDEAAFAGQAEAIWELATRLSHQDAGIGLVPAATTLPLSDLHSSERCDVVMPDSLFEAPGDTAWLALQLDIGKLADSAAGIGFQRLRPMLSAGLRFADNLVDCIEWPWASLRLDAILNRRVALHVVGIGDLVDRLGLDPSEFRSLRQLSRWLMLLKQMMTRESGLLARERGAFPGLGVKDLVRSLAPHYGHADAERLIRRRSLRHRHLMAISPYAIFPVGSPRYPLALYQNLLPTIKCADTINMYGDHARHRLSLEHFRQLVRMTWVIAVNRL